MCEPTIIASTALNAAGSIAQHGAASAQVSAQNRAKLANYHHAQKLYDREVMLDRANYKNDTAIADIQQDQVYQAMIDQWSEADAELDDLFAQADRKIEKAVIEMYENDYAGTQTGKTAARLAGQSAKKLGMQKAEVLHEMMMSKDEVARYKESSRRKTIDKSREIYEQVRFAPIHGARPQTPQFNPQPSKAGMIIGIASAGVQGWKDADEAGLFD